MQSLIFTSIFYRKFASYVKIFIYTSFVAYNLLKSNYAESGIGEFMNDSVTIAFLGLLFLLSYGGTISSTQLLLLLALMTTAACACGGNKRTLISGLADGNGLLSGGTTTGNATTSTTTTTTTRTTGNN